MVNRTNTELLHQILSKKNWRHRVSLTPDIVTPGYCDESEWKLALLPETLNEKSFLDVASNDGMYSIQADKRGASKVLGIDIYADKANGLNMTDGWDFEKPHLLKDYFQSKAEFLSRSVYDLSSLSQGYDYVFCSNLIAWLTDPYTAIKALSDVCNEVLHFREDVSSVGKIPMLEWVHTKPGTCYYNPNKAYFMQVLKEIGFKKVEFNLIDERNLLQERIARQVLLKIKKDAPVYSNPYTLIETANIQDHKWYLSYSNCLGYYFLENLGWIKEDAILETQPLLLGRSYPYLSKLNKILNNKLNLEKNFVIKAYK